MAIASPRFRVIGGDGQPTTNPPCVECRHYRHGGAWLPGGVCTGHSIYNPVHGAMHQMAYVHRVKGGLCGTEGRHFARRRWWHPDESPGVVFGVFPVAIVVAAIVAIYFVF